MSAFRKICAVIFFIVAASTLKGQSVSGSTTVDIDPDTGMVTATCETDVDWASQGYYQPIVSCLLQDGDGNYITSGQEQDFNGTVSAVVVLQVQGVAGTTYVATGDHMAMFTLPTDSPEDDPCGFCQIDEYNFQEISNEFFNGGVPYAYPITFYGPGPEEETPAHVILIANTTAAGKAAPLIESNCETNISTSRLLATWGTLGCHVGAQVYAVQPNESCVTSNGKYGAKHCAQSNVNGCITTTCPIDDRTISKDCLTFTDGVAYAVIQTKLHCTP